MVQDENKENIPLKSPIIDDEDDQSFVDHSIKRHYSRVIPQ